MSYHDENEPTPDQSIPQSVEQSDRTLPNYVKGVFGWIYWMVVCIFIIGMITWRGETLNYIFSWIFSACLIVYFVFYFSAAMTKTREGSLMNVTTGVEVINESENTTTRRATNQKRIFFLDNIKIVLTAIVVSHNVSCSFGGCGPNSWPLVIGLPKSEETRNFFNIGITYMNLLNQSYFMPLFFFISAYFIPSSYERKETWKFHYDKCKRLLLPCIVIILIQYPVTIFLSQSITNSPLVYTPLPGHTWYVLWLSFFGIIYSSLVTNTATVTLKMPSTIVRTIFGLLICGGLMFAMIEVMDPVTHFLFMPVTVGSLVCDVAFFILGTIAFRSDWLIQPIRDQLDIPVWLLRLFVLVEALAIYACWFFSIQFTYLKYVWVILCGLFCVDMSLATLELFQCHFDFQTPLLKNMADSAYGVYLIHPLFVVCLNTITIDTYRVGEYGFGIQFDTILPNSNSIFAGPQNGAVILLLLWLLINILSQILVWPFAYRLKQIPFLKSIL